MEINQDDFKVNENNREVNNNEINEETVDIELPFLRNLAGWATFKAVIEIIFGALSCLPIITAVFGIPQVISGIRLLNATDDLKRYISTGDTRNIGDALYNFNKFFKFSGIAIIIRIIFFIILIILYIVILTYIWTNFNHILENIPEGFIPF